MTRTHGTTRPARPALGPVTPGSPISPWLQKRGPAVLWGWPGRNSASLPLAAHHHDGAVRVVHNLIADRADQQPAEAAPAAGPDDDQVGRARCLDQLLRREAAGGTHRHRGWLGI